MNHTPQIDTQSAAYLEHLAAWKFIHHGREFPCMEVPPLEPAELAGYAHAELQFYLRYVSRLDGLMGGLSAALAVHHAPVAPELWAALDALRVGVDAAVRHVDSVRYLNQAEFAYLRPLRWPDAYGPGGTCPGSVDDFTPAPALPNGVEQGNSAGGLFHG